MLNAKFQPSNVEVAMWSFGISFSRRVDGCYFEVRRIWIGLWNMHIDICEHYMLEYAKQNLNASDILRDLKIYNRNPGR